MDDSGELDHLALIASCIQLGWSIEDATKLADLEAVLQHPAYGTTSDNSDA